MGMKPSAAVYKWTLKPSASDFESTVGKQTPCKLSFVYTSQVNLIVRTEPKFGKYLMPFI